MSSQPLLTMTLAAALAAGAAHTAHCQSPGEPNEGSHLEWDAANSIWRFSWWGVSGRTYFIQHSEDLAVWSWVPIVEPGSDAVREWGFTTTGDRFFLRLVHTDIPTADPANDDFDGDGVPNLEEVLQNTNPLLENNPPGFLLLEPTGAQVQLE